MSDLLINLSTNKMASLFFKKAGVPLPQPLRRTAGPWVANPLAGLRLKVSHSSVAADIVRAAGAQLEDAESHLDGIVIDASDITRYDDLPQFFEAAQKAVRVLRENARVLVLAKASKAIAPSRIALRQALVGFTKSLGKEIGKTGSTANILFYDEASSELLTGPIRFFLSAKSAFISGQSLVLDSTLAKKPPALFLTSQLRGKTALVTGAAQGIGLAVAQQLAKEGARIIGLDRPDVAESLSSSMATLSGSSLVCDLTESGFEDRICRHVLQEGGVDIVVHNAGLTRDKKLVGMSASHWQSVLDVNLKATLALCDAFIGNELLLKNQGRVILMSSIAGIAGNVGQTAYAASKAALIGYTEAMGKYEEAMKRGIGVNSVAPGFIETSMTAKMPLAVREVARRFNSLGQAGLPDDVAHACAFLASPLAWGISGQVLRVCGQNYIGA